METYNSDDETAEAVKKWWRENGKSVVGGAVIGLAAVFGWQGWQQHVTSQGEEAAAVYETMMVRLNAGSEEVNGLAERLRSAYPSTPYATLGALAQAKLSVERGALAEAETHLRWAIKNSPMGEMAALARLRLARVLAADDRADEALTLIAEVQGFEAVVEELRGDILLARGDREGAKSAFLAARQAGGNDATLDLKIDQLGG